jgi:hypothetical protein
MKKTLALAAVAVLAGSVGAFAQGTVNFAEASDVTVLIYAPNPSNPGVEVTGNSVGDTPAGQTTYTGGTIGGNSTSTGSAGYGNGNNFTAELFGAAGSGLAFSQLSPLTQYSSGFAVKPGGAGQFIGSSPSPDPGISGTGLTSAASATLALAAWYNGGGTITSLAAAEAASVPYGWSTPFSLTGLGGTGTPPATPPDLVGLTSFSLVSPVSTTPEPGTITLGLMGAAAFFARRRKQQ